MADYYENSNKITALNYLSKCINTLEDQDCLIKYGKLKRSADGNLDENAIKVLAIDKEAHIMQFVPYNSSETFKTKTIRLDDEETLAKLTYHKVVSVNKLKFNNRAARLKLIGR
jgi:hypothetical protein